MHLTLIIVGFAAGLIGALLGLGGGWLIVPALSVMGWSATVSVGTSLATMFMNSTVSVYKYWRRGRLQPRLGLAFGLFALLGVQLGRRLLIRLDDAAHAEVFLRSAYIIILLLMALTMLRRRPQAEHSGVAKPKWRWHFGPQVGTPPYRLYLYQAGVGGTIAGMASGLLGIGGGIILVPMLTGLFGLPILNSVAISVTSILFGSVSGSISYLAAGQVDFPAAAFLAIGSISGTYVGVHFSEDADEQQLRRLFVGLAVFIAASVLALLLGYKEQAPIILFSGTGLGVVATLYILLKKKVV